MDVPCSQRCYSLKDLARELPDEGSPHNAVESWAIPANHSSYGVNNFKWSYPAQAENFLIWSSRTLDIYTDINIKEAMKADKKKSATTTATANIPSAFTNPAFVELKAQKPISPLSVSPEFQNIRKCSAAGHALHPRCLGVAFSTTSCISRPLLSNAHPRGKPRKPQAFNNKRTTHF
ncbi:hypothetical protein Ndes2526B_g06555 [Nannochloris sp. 'desiccata']|nr:hypothetical protein KSW81_008288 [Chlorella desiccata (nom. nud.)]KAH7619574.1 hypothetical protein NADE_006407 [Chlorella desiccata (nom. nud.)]